VTKEQTETSKARFAETGQIPHGVPNVRETICERDEYVHHIGFVLPSGVLIMVNEPWHVFRNVGHDNGILEAILEIVF